MASQSRLGRNSCGNGIAVQHRVHDTYDHGTDRNCATDGLLDVWRLNKGTVAERDSTAEGVIFIATRRAGMKTSSVDARPYQGSPPCAKVRSRFYTSDRQTAADCGDQVGDLDPAFIRKVKKAFISAPRFEICEADIARSMGLSARTLRRRLQSFGTSYTRTIAQARFAIAKQCLSDPLLTIYDVAERVGYSEVSNFGIAFKRWAGCSPQAFRQRLG